jgi:hypothetical protein
MKNFLLIFLLASNALLIHGAAVEGARTWTSTSGTELTAELVSAAGGKVVFKAAEGRVINLRLDQLSKADQEYLASLDKKKPAADIGAGKTDDTVNTVIDPEAWYASGIGDKEAFLTEFLLKAGRRRNFEVPAGGNKEIFVGFTAKESSGFLLTSRSDRSEILATSRDVGEMSWTVKSGKVRLTIRNKSKVDTRVMIYTRNNGKDDE